MWKRFFGKKKGQTNDVKPETSQNTRKKKTMDETHLGTICKAVVQVATHSNSNKLALLPEFQMDSATLERYMECKGTGSGSVCPDSTEFGNQTSTPNAQIIQTADNSIQTERAPPTEVSASTSDMGNQTEGRVEVSRASGGRGEVPHLGMFTPALMDEISNNNNNNHHHQQMHSNSNSSNNNLDLLSRMNNFAETSLSYETPIEQAENEQIVNPDELLRALEDLAMQQDASGDN